VNTQTIGLIGTFILAALVLVCYTVLTGMDKDTESLLNIVGGLGIAGVVQGAALIRPGTPSGS
jgi:hypothetical protein